MERETHAIRGLSEAEARERLRAGGYNELPSSGGRSLPSIALGVVREPMFLLLIGGGAIYLLLGDVREAAMLLVFVFVVMGITLYQERKTERALEALRDLSSPRALVIRDGLQRRIPGREVVRGDIVLLSEGDRVPADALLLSAVNLAVDESLLTGESAPVRKAAACGTVETARPGGDDLPFVYSGTLVVQGSGIAEVIAVGCDTELGRIGKALETISQEETLLQKETASIVRRLAVAGLSLCGLVVILYGITRTDWLHGFLAGISLAMAVLPEEFPVVLTIFLSLGAWRMSRRQVLTRRIPAVETLGSATVLCVDKTGTLTMNRMSVSALSSQGRSLKIDGSVTDLPEDFHEVVEFGILASSSSPFDPMEKALLELGDRALSETGHIHSDWSLVQEYPLSRALLAMSRVWRSPDNINYVIAAKGAPEAIADICHLDGHQLDAMEKEVSAMAEEGLRVIGVAKSEFSPATLPNGQHDFAFTFLGLIGMADPVREGVAGAVQECYEAGIRVVMITGDYPATARNIAQRIGLRRPGHCITGPELEKMDDLQLKDRVGSVSIFARVVPEQKLRIVRALKESGEVVAMTGDGVNDAPALKAAHIGIAMGGRGTDVAREASDIVLIEDDFSSIVGAVRMGRRIYGNLRKAMAYILAIHVPIAGMSLLPVLMRWPLVLLPVHIVFLELIIDPACSVAFEAEREEEGVMNAPPRRLDDPLFSRKTIAISLMQGVSVLLIVIAVFAVAMQRGLQEDDARALAFTTLIVANLGLILTNRSWSRTILSTLRSPNAALWWVVGGSAVFLAAVLYVPFLRGLFRFSTLHAVDIVISLAAGLLSILWFEGMKMMRRRSHKDHSMS